MAIIAVDIVLLPPEPIIEQIIKLNSKLQLSDSHNLFMNKLSCVPHLSIAMAGIQEEDINEITTSLQSALLSTAYTIQVTGLISKMNPREQVEYSLAIEKNDKLQKLHQIAIEILNKYHNFNITHHSFVTPPQIQAPTIQWVQKYAETSAFEKFNPHITVGFGHLSEKIGPFQFTSSTIALFQLGDYCTCKKLLRIICD